jgi:putative phosphoribosyl transferase
MYTAPLFRDRTEAGRALAARLADYADKPDVLVLALPRGGVPIGYEVARALRVPLDVFLVRKLGLPGHEELAMGAIASGDVRVLNQELIEYVGVPREVIDHLTAIEQRELRRREQLYRGDRPPPELRGRCVVLVDDGLATGATMRAGTEALRRAECARIVVAVPVAAADTCEELSRLADEVVCLMTPEPFFGVGMWYEDFSQLTDEQVRELLARADRELHALASR